MASENPAVVPTVNVSESGGKNVICVSTGITAVAAALIVIFVPFIAVTVVPTVTPATSTISPTEILVFASTAITVAPSATCALFSTDAPNPSASTKFTSPPTIAADVVALLARVIVVPLILPTAALVGIPSPKIRSPTAMFVASATVIVVDEFEAVAVV